MNMCRHVIGKTLKSAVFFIILLCISGCLTQNYFTLKQKLKDFQWNPEYENKLTATIINHKNWELIDDPDVPCGENAADRIIGGKEASLGQHPWVARMGRYKLYHREIKGRVDWFCGGTLISRFYVITAGHCAVEPNFKVVRLGEYDANSTIDCDEQKCADPPQDYYPTKILIHKGFDGSTSITPHDIALLRLDQPVTITDWVLPACLPRYSSESLWRDKAETIGWGLTIPVQSSYPAILQTIMLPIISEPDCQKRYYRRLARGTFCAGGEIMEDSCNGDSGGPLLKVDDTSGIPRYYLIGIVSFGPTYCGNGEAGGYTNITSHLPWILDNVSP